MKRIILSVVFVIIIIFGFAVNTRQVCADVNYDGVGLDELYEMKDDPEELAKVTGIYAVSMEGYHNAEEKLEIVKQCPNLSYVNICDQTITLDKDFINGLSYNGDEEGLFLVLQWCTVDLEGVDNPYVTSLFLKECKLENYEGVLGFENLNHLQVDSAMGFSQVDYSKLTNLKELALVAQRVEDYKYFFQKTSHLKDLSLQCCNLQNSDTRYLAYYMKDIECLNLYGTYVDDISFLKKLDKLEAVTLPLGVSDLDVLYEMPYLQSIDFDAYTELFVDEELTQFFDDNEIFYPYFDRDIREKVDNIVAGMNITEQMTDDEKILEVTETMLKIMTCEDVPAYTFEGTTLDICVNHGVGVCHDFSTIEYTLLKCVGIDAYLINGWALDYYGNPPLAHAWNEVCIDGEWYGIEPMWIDIEINDPSDVEFRESLWAIWYMKSTKTDDIYAWPENGDYTGSEDKIFALSHVTMNDPMDTVGQSGPAVEDKYTVEFLDDDGTVLFSSEYEFGTSAADITPEDPSKDRDAQYTYEFSGWEPEVTDVEEDATYKATYIKITNEYKISFVNEDGTELSSRE